MVEVTEKQKAEQMARLFKDKSDNGWFVCEDFAKRCALACVDEIIKSEPTMPLNYYEDSDGETQAQSQLNYWEKVKEEIKKL